MTNKVISIAKKSGSIVLCRKNIRDNSLYDYEVLMVERKSQLQFGSVMAFPGGKVDSMDQQIKNQYNFQQKVQATAVRQCFEETGIFLAAQPILQTNKLNQIQKIKNQYVVQSLQGNLYSFEPYFMKLCSKLQPQTNLQPFIRLITIPLLKSRFDTSFYLALLEPYKFLNFGKYAQKQQYLHESHEIIMGEEFKSFRWMSPVQVIKEFKQSRIKLAPPQYIMLNVMSSFSKYMQLSEFLRTCHQSQISMASNIVSIVFNKGYLKEQFPFAATLVGDQEFPFLKNAETQRCQSLREQILSDMNNIDVRGKNRILFTKPKQFFEEEFDVQCTIPGSILNKLNNSKKMKQIVDLYS